MKKEFLLCALTAVTALLIGCGGGGGSGSTTTSAATLTASFVDAPTKGLSYTASPSGLSGTTDANGSYQFQAGDTVTFTLPVGSSSITIGTVTPTSGEITFVLNLAHGEQVAHVLQALNHAAGTSNLDVSGITLSSTDSNTLNAYIASSGTILPGIATVTPTAITNALAAVQAAATLPAGATVRTQANAAFLETVSAHMRTTIGALPQSSGISLSALVPNSLAFTAGLNDAPGATPYYLLKYNNPNGSSFARTSAPNINNYPVVTYSLPPTGNIYTQTYSSPPSGSNIYPSYANTMTVKFATDNIMLGTYNVTGGDLPEGGASGSFASHRLDTTFNLSSVAGKTLTLAALQTHICTVAHPFQITFDSTGTNYTRSCQGTTALVPTPATGTASVVSTMPGILNLLPTGSSQHAYIGLMNGSALSNGTLALIVPPVGNSAGLGMLLKVQAQNAPTPTTTSSTAPTTSTSSTSTTSTSSSTSTTTTTSLSTTSVPKVVPTQGDYYTFAFTHSPTGGSSSNFSYIRNYATVNGDGSAVRIETFSNGVPAKTLNMDAMFGITSHSYMSGSVLTTCTATPSNIVVPLPATTSTTWNTNFAQTCTGGSPSTSTFNNTGAVTAIETVVTPAGTFTAGKFVFTQTEVRTGAYTQVINYTCWIDTVMGRTVKCNNTYVYTPVSGTGSSGSETFSLTGYSAAGYSSAPTVARFAGAWSGSYTGYSGTSNTGTCSNLVVNTSGAITGSCTDNFAGVFTVTGTVNAAGAASLVASTGVTFSGTLFSTTNGSGTWVGIPNGGGTWAATHK